MRKVLGVLTAFVVSGYLGSASLADQITDVARVEREIEATRTAALIYRAAKSRAESAVRRSSITREYEQINLQWRKFEQGEEISVPASRLRELRVMYKEQIAHLVMVMTDIFLNEEIKKAERNNRGAVVRELKRLR